MARKNYKEKVEVADIKQLDSNTENEAENIVSIQKEEIIDKKTHHPLVFVKIDNIIILFSLNNKNTK